MKKTLLALLTFTTIMNACTQTQDNAGYIGPQDIQVQGGVMTPEVLLALGRLSDPQLSPDGSSILYGVSYNSVADNRSCRNLYLCNADGGGNVQLTCEAKSINNARWSSDGNSIFYLQGGQLYKAPLAGDKLGKAVKLSEVPAGISEFKLSPDQSMILYLSTIPGPVKTAADSDPALDKAEAYVAEDLMYRHWDHWVTETPRSFVASLSATVTPETSADLLGSEPFELPTEPFSGAEQLDWSPDGKYIAYSCRKKMGKEYAFSTNTDIYVYELATGKEVQVTCGGGYDTDPVWSPDGSRLAWISMARDGYEADLQRLMVADFASGVATNIRCVLPDFDHDVAGPSWGPDGKCILFESLVDGLQKLFCATVDGQLKQLTCDDWKFDFKSAYASDEKDGELTLYATYCSLNAPLELVNVKVGAQSCFCQVSNINSELLGKLDEPTSEAVWLETVDHKQMLCWVMYPPHFDPSKKYPAIEICLGGPQGTLSQGWSYRWNYRMMAQQGYVVIMPNRRGTTAFGQEWKEQISGDYCGLNIQDYITAGNYIKSQPYIDKVAACGASYGGYSVYYLAGVHGDLFDCFIAHAGIFDEEYLYYTTEEMWFANWENGGLTEYAYEAGKTGPAGDGITYGGMQQAGSPWSTKAKAIRHYSNSPHLNVRNWHTPILCFHGGKDFRIPYDQGMAAFNCAQMMGVPSKLVVFPEENHWILKPQNAVFWHRTYFDWLDKWMKQ